ncbi:MAG: hypothetical protein ACO1SX_28810 [Actinomycetota bacterium]
MSIAVDNRQVVLLKSLRTNNRFYALVAPESGYKNADAISEFPLGMPLGIAYPCLEDGLNDFAVIRTTFETIDAYPDDVELRDELMGIIADARSNLVRRLEELRDKIQINQAHFLGTDLEEFKDHVVHMATKGTIRRTLDNMMKVDVFDSVSRSAAATGNGQADPMYRYEFLPEHELSIIRPLTPRLFIGRLFDDVLDAVNNDGNYTGKYSFDLHVFQKFIAVMFVNYATTDQMYYGTSREDYGVSSDKNMQETPLYRAVKAALQDLEQGIEYRHGTTGTAEPAAVEGGEDLSALFGDGEFSADLLSPFEHTSRSVEIEFGDVEAKILQPLTKLGESLRLLKQMEHPRSEEIRAIILAAGKELFRNLQEMDIVSPLANDPLDRS